MAIENPFGSTSDEELHRGLSRWNALAIVVGSVIGTGIYIRPAFIAQLVGTPSANMLVWIAAGLLSLAGTLTYSELAARIPRSGGEYAYLRETLGEVPAFLYGWMRLTVGIGTIADLQWPLQCSWPISFRLAAIGGDRWSRGPITPSQSALNRNSLSQCS